MTAPLDPQMKAFLDVANAAGPLFLRAETPEQARAKMMALLEANKVEPTPIYRIEDRLITGPHGSLPLRIYTPEGRPPMGILLYFHGGGWVLGNLETHDGLCRNLAKGAGCVVIAVDYRLAPEHKFPAGLEDCYAATKWAGENAAALGGDSSHIAVGGDSAGGTLATAVAILAHRRGGPRLCFQLLFYPAISSANDTPSQKEFADDGFVLSRGDMNWFWERYLNSPADAKNPLACPQAADAKELAALPPALVETASHDPLRDEGEAYAERMRKAGVSVVASRYDGVTHGFVSFSELLDKGKQGLKQATDALRAAFAL